MIKMPNTEVEYVRFFGGIDQASPVLSIKPGYLLDCVNYEPGINGGYRRIDGYERFDGRTRPSTASYWLMPCTITGTVAVGDTVTGVTSAATGKVLQVNASELVLGRVSGTFSGAETINVGAVGVATTTGATSPNVATTGLLHLTYKHLAANDYRADIGAVPGSGNILGAVMYNDVLYAWRNNAGGTAAVMHKSTASGWTAVTMPYEMTYSAGHFEPAEGKVVLGLTSSALGTIRRVVNRVGSWGTTAAGSLVLDTMTGAFSSGEVVADNVDKATATASSKVSTVAVSSKIATVTITIASPAVISWTAHGLVADSPVIFATTGALPTGLTAGTTYYVIAAGLTADAFEVSDTIGGAAINTSGTQSGTHTATSPTDAVVSWTAHGLAADDPVVFSTTGALPTGITAGTTYYVIATGLTVDAFEISASLGGAAVQTYGAQSGTHTATSPAVCSIGWTAHGKVANDAVVFTTTGALPTGLAAGAVYYVIAAGLTANTFEVSATLGGSAIVTYGTQSGTHTCYRAYVTTSSVSAQIALAASGRYEFRIANFYGQQDKTRLYGVDGKNPAFEFDGTYFVPIHTGMTADTPTHLHVHKKHLFLSFKSSAQHSSIGDPHGWSAITGAAELAVGEVINGFETQPGEVLAIVTRNMTYQLLGSSSADWKLDVLTPETGAIEHTIQNLGYSFMLDDRGVIRIAQTLNYGNFEHATMSRMVQRTIDLLRSKAIASTVYRSRNQYRLYGNDGTGIIMGLENGKVTGITKFEYPVSPTCVWSGEDTTGAERIFFGDSNGYVYEANAGTSFDGAQIDAFIFPPHNTSRTPRHRKQYRKVVLEIVSDEYSEISFYPEFSFGDMDVASHAVISASSESGTGGVWDISTWDTFFYDGKSAALPEYSISGAGVSISMIFFSRSAIDPGHTLSGMMVHYTLRRLSR